MQSDHLYSICLIVQIFGSSSLRQFDHERNSMFFITIPPKSGHILEKTQRYGFQFIFFQLNQENKNLPQI